MFQQIDIFFDSGLNECTNVVQKESNQSPLHLFGAVSFHHGALRFKALHQKWLSD
ncbi:hypothetical protein JCM19233_5307 [Vibrio astriarenae]|nr:hypothetical protein JCM19233_5307 [Vibrio sp. C7]